MFVLKHLAHMIETICNMKCYASQSFNSETKPLFSFIFCRIQVGLLDHVYTSLEECVEGSTLQHTILKQGEVD